MDTKGSERAGFDGSAAVTRSLLGWGVVAGVIYLGVGVLLGLTRDGFEFARHPLSVLMLGEQGWMQRANLVLAGLMTLAAAAGFVRATSGARDGGRGGRLVGLFGVCLVASAVFAPDPMAGFPPGTPAGDPSIGGVLHLAFGAIGFVSLAAAMFAFANWFAGRPDPGWAKASRASGVVVALGFLGGAVLATQPVGVASLWIAVVTGWVWLGAASIHLYGLVPHPDLHRRTPRTA
jgi:hypothetical protein